MKKLTILIPVALCICFQAFAQNIDQTVQVTNEYMTLPVTAEKNGVDMFVPDTATRFKLDFDYNVFDNPYNGAYEFVPYSVKFTPAPTVYDGRKFHLKAGAGYSLHPVLDASFIPVCDSVVEISVYQKLNGFAGTYAEGFGGFHFSENLGVTGQYNMKSASLVFDAGYKGFLMNDSKDINPLHSLYIGAGVKSRKNEGSYFKYDVNLGYKFGADFAFQKFPSVNAHVFNAYGTVGPVFNGKYAFLVDFDLDFEKYSGLPETKTSVWKDTKVTADNVIPHFAMRLGPVSLKAGAAFSYGYDGKSIFTIYPDVRFEVRLAKVVKLYASVTGGVDATDYLQVKDEDPWYFDIKNSVQWIQKTVRDFDVKAGISGRIGNHFGFDINGVRVKYLNGRLPDAYQFYSFADYVMKGANASLYLNTRRVDADLNFHYRITDIMADMAVFDLPRFSGSASVTYNYARRLFVGARADASTARYAFVEPLKKVSDKNIPAYVNVGLDIKFYFTKKFAIWLDASNLLGHTISYHYGISENGRAFTGGIVLDI